MQSGDVCDGYHEMDEVPCWIREKITMRGIGACLQQDLNHRHTLTERPGKETFGKSERVGKAEKVGKLTFVNGWVYKCDNDGDQAGEFVPSDFEQKVDISQNWRRRKRKQESVEINRVNPGVGFDEVYAQVREISEDSRETHDNTVHGKDSMTQNRMWKKESDPMNGAGPNIHQRMNANTLDISSGLVSKQKRFGIPINKKSRQNGAEKNELLHRSKVFEEETLNVSEKMYIQLKAENEKLRMVVNDLQNHMEVVHFLARQGSRNCQHCMLIMEKMKDMIGEDDSEKTQAIAENIPVSPTVQPLLVDDARLFESPMDSCASAKKIVCNDRLEKRAVSHEVEEKLNQNELISALISLTKPVEADTFVRKDSDGCHEEASDAECHLCIELASQTDDRLEDDEKVAEFQSEECVSKQHPELDHYLESLHKTSRDKKGGKSMFERGGQNSINQIDVHGFEERIGDVAQNSCETFDGGTGKRGDDDGYIDLKCGCTSQKFGDTCGILRLYQSGMLEIYCQCCSECIKGKPMTPANFEKHGGRGASKKWKDTIWIVLGDQKVMFSKVKGLDAFVRRYKESRSRSRQVHAAKSVYHRDEFMQCKKCSKKCRMRCKTQEECRLYHNASMNPDWECANYPYDRFMSCQEEEEREARQVSRGCMRSRTCQGCAVCICSGCSICRFEDCSCEICEAFKAINNQ